MYSSGHIPPNNIWETEAWKQPLGRIVLVVRLKVPSKVKFSVGGFETFKAGGGGIPMWTPACLPP